MKSINKVIAVLVLSISFLGAASAFAAENTGTLPCTADSTKSDPKAQDAPKTGTQPDAPKIDPKTGLPAT